ncbi:MAG: hypothetical protein JJU26_00135 [Oceanicaulis sp.]|nr:hypothetical protein [Oceanicaulis sp.]
MQSKSRGCDHLPAPDKAAFKALPENISVFRGCDRDSVMGLIWTLDRHRAELDAGGFRHGVIASGISPKRDLYALYVDRGEVLLDPFALDVLSVSTMTAR